MLTMYLDQQCKLFIEKPAMAGKVIRRSPDNIGLYTIKFEGHSGTQEVRFR